MAHLFFGLASSHSGQLNTPPERWSARREKDIVDRRINFNELKQKAKAGIENEITPEKMAERFNACTQAVDDLARVLAEVSPDILVVIGDDQNEQFHSENMPSFCVYHGDLITVARRTSHNQRKVWKSAERWEIEDDLKTYPSAPEFAKYLIEFLVEKEFDPARSNRLKPEVGIGHAFNFIYRRLMTSGRIPIVPIMVNTFFPPNQPTPQRCYKLGQALKLAIEEWPGDQTIAVMGSGGLSHVILDEEIDRMALDAMLRKDSETLCSLPVDRLNLGTSEIRNWIVAAGALDHLNMNLINYVPCYRSEAGTGCGMAFAVWRP